MPELGKATYWLTLNSAEYNAGLAEAEVRSTAATNAIARNFGIAEGSMVQAGAAAGTMAEEVGVASGSMASSSGRAAGATRALSASTIGLGGAMTKAADKAKHLAGFAGLGAVYLMAKGGIDTMRQNEQGLLLVGNAIDATGRKAGVTRDHAEALAETWMRLTGASKASTLQLEQLGLRFTNIRNVGTGAAAVFDRFIENVQNLALATGKSSRALGIALGKALQDPSKYMAMLARSGVTFTKQQVSQIKALQASGNMLGAQEKILAALDSRYKGTAESLRNSFTVQIRRAKEQLNESSAVIVRALLPAFKTLLGGLATLASVISHHTALFKTLLVTWAAWKIAMITGGLALKLYATETAAATAATRLFGGAQVVAGAETKATTAAIEMEGTAAATAGVKAAGLRTTMAAIGRMGALVLGITLLTQWKGDSGGIGLAKKIGVAGLLGYGVAGGGGAIIGAGTVIVYETIKHTPVVGGLFGAAGKAIGGGLYDLFGGGGAPAANTPTGDPRNAVWRNGQWMFKTADGKWQALSSLGSGWTSLAQRQWDAKHKAAPNEHSVVTLTPTAGAAAAASGVEAPGGGKHALTPRKQEKIAWAKLETARVNAEISKSKPMLRKALLAEREFLHGIIHNGRRTAAEHLAAMQNLQQVNDEMTTMVKAKAVVFESKRWTTLETILAMAVGKTSQARALRSELRFLQTQRGRYKLGSQNRLDIETAIAGIRDQIISMRKATLDAFKVPARFRIAISKAEQTAGLKDDIAAFKVEQGYLEDLLKHMKKGTDKYARVEAELARVDKRLRDLRKKEALRKAAARKEVQAARDLRGTFFAEFAPGVFHKSEDGLMMGGTTTAHRSVTVHQTHVYQEIPKDRHAEARRTRTAVEAALR